MNDLFKQTVACLSTPTFKGSYETGDCIFMLKDIGDAIQEEGNEEREDRMDGGIHYSEMLPIESFPSKEYLNLFHSSLKSSSPLMAQYVADVAEMILLDKGEDVVLVSLARAGTPIGVLVKRYLKYRYGMNVAHYSVSIIRGKGLDVNAILYIANQHQGNPIQFIDGWTGKGTINKVLHQSIELINKRYELSLMSDLAVLADPAQAAPIFGTRSDYFLPSSCLNSIVSGLASRTVHRDDIIGSYDYHGAKYYERWEKEDLSRLFIETVEKEFDDTLPNRRVREEVTNRGWGEVEEVKQRFNINSINKVKPGIGETTRVLLRRVPWKILVKNMNAPEMKHILMLANDKGVPVEMYKNMSYSCMGLIKE
ncbi:cysteine protease StiP family protein [Brevibacillus sp. NPDC058079]|uniref:cysteine protease StiP family protein n=1 Tax=Brevibacillus sp. NPDC058079 TaxID=3346330 RepID=UPI0036E97008